MKCKAPLRAQRMCKVTISSRLTFYFVGKARAAHEANLEGGLVNVYLVWGQGADESDLRSFVGELRTRNRFVHVCVGLPGHFRVLDSLGLSLGFLGPFLGPGAPAIGGNVKVLHDISVGDLS